MLNKLKDGKSQWLAKLISPAELSSHVSICTGVVLSVYKKKLAFFISKLKGFYKRV